MVSVLVKIFGPENIEMAEDVVQDALVRALETWKYKGLPDNPRAWLYRTAKNKAIDILRKNRHSLAIDFSDPQKQLLTSEYTLTQTMNNYWKEQHIEDDFLGMMYACCHPDISQENQITFILKSLCGFSTKEVARSFLTNEETISKRLFRTKDYFRKHKIRPTIPPAQQIESRTTAVLQSIYLMFNEGYNATQADEIIRKDLIEQAMHLCESLLKNEKTRTPEAYALMALMCFHSARTESRLTGDGELILLSEQDRSTWNQELISAGLRYLTQSADGVRLTSYHLEAFIAHAHCNAKSYEETDWAAILTYYDTLFSITQDPVVLLNRSLVIMELKGPKSALEALEEIKDTKALESYYLYYAILGAIHERLQDPEKAITNFNMAIQLSQSKKEQEFLRERIASLSSD